MTDTSDDGIREETWVFLGSVVSTKGTRLHGWASTDEPDREMRFSAKGRYTIGGNYQVRVSRTDGVTMHGTPVYVEAHPDMDLRTRISARHRAAEITLSRQALERSQNRVDPLNAALAPLIALARTVPASQRDAFASYVMRNVLRVW